MIVPCVAVPRVAVPCVAVVVKGWPRLSETFIAQELVALERRGLALGLWSLRLPTDRKAHPLAAALAAPVSYLPEYLRRAPARVWRGWRVARLLPGYAAARAAFLRDLARDPTPNRARRFGQALVLAAELPAETSLIYAHFLHTPASVARYAATMRGLKWSVSAHAKDIWTTPAWEKREKLEAAAWAVTCTAAGALHLDQLAPGKVELVPHGLDAARFPPFAGARAPRDGGDPADPATILSVGRAVTKKGYDDLLDALARLPRDLHWRFVHIGGGPLLPALERQAERLGIAGRIDWRGACTQDDVLAALRAADLFVLASRIAKDGDRDGLPNVLMEAMSQRLPALATAVGAIPELITDGLDGALVSPGDREALARRMAALIADPWARAALGDAGAERVRRDFAFARHFERLARRFGLPPARAARPAERQIRAAD